MPIETVGIGLNMTATIAFSPVIEGTLGLTIWHF
jgi:hypothetical protein